MENQLALDDNNDLVTEVAHQQTEVIRRLVSSVIGTPEQQHATLETLFLNTLHKAKARRLMMQYVREYVEAKLQKQLKQALDQQHDLILDTIKSELDKAKEELRAAVIIDPAARAQLISRQNFHTLDEIRAIVMDNIESIQSYFKGRCIAARALFDHLETYTELRPGDKELLTNGNPRWNQQVGNAIRESDWPETPFKRGRRGYYELEYWKSAP